MQSNLLGLAKQAIDAALRSDWKRSIVINLQILEKTPDNTEAMTRLGRAYIQTKQYSKAKKLFEEVLALDPINQIALRNLKIAKEKKTSNNGHAALDTTLLIKEPGTSTEARLTITAPRLTADSFSPGESFTAKSKKGELDIYRGDKLIGSITDPDIVKRVYCNQSRITVSYVRGTDKEMIVLLHADTPIFKAEKQDVRPYLKKGSIDEPDLELSELDEEEEPVEQEAASSDEE